MKKHFDNLGLPPTATISDVKKAYRKLAMRLHPDKNPTPLAAELFTELQHSYETLLNHLDPNKPIFVVPDSVHPRKTKSKEERIAEAKKRFEEQKLREHRENEAYFKALTQGKKWRIYKIGVLFCTSLAIFFIIDNLLPSRKIIDQVIAVDWKVTGGLTNKHTHNIFLKSENKIYVDKLALADFERYPSVYLIQSPIFHLQKKIIHPIENELKEYQLDWNLHSVLYFVVLFLLIPLISRQFVAKTPQFVFSFYFSLYVVFPATLLLLLLENRWLHMITLGFI